MMLSQSMPQPTPQQLMQMKGLKRAPAGAAGRQDASVHRGRRSRTPSPSSSPSPRTTSTMTTASSATSSMMIISMTKASMKSSTMTSR
jgi:hypothetical protein